MQTDQETWPVAKQPRRIRNLSSPGTPLFKSWLLGGYLEYCTTQLLIPWPKMKIKKPNA